MKINDLLSPSLLVYPDLIQQNTAAMIRVAGSPQRLRPHCKTHKMSAVTRMEMERGIRKHKCATFAEAEMLADAGVTDIFLAYNLVGPNLRGSGLRYDVRKDEPYSIYPEVEFDVPVGRGEMGTVGDCFDRYIVRIREMKESCRIIRQCLKQIPKGPVIAKVARNFKPPAGDCYVRLESARGDMGWYVVSDGTSFPYRCKIRTGSFAAISLVPKVSRNLMIADLIAVIASFDLVAPEIDR